MVLQITQKFNNTLVSLFFLSRSPLFELLGMAVFVRPTSLIY